MYVFVICIHKHANHIHWYRSPHIRHYKMNKTRYSYLYKKLTKITGHYLFEQNLSPPTVLLHPSWTQKMVLTSTTLPKVPELCLSSRPLYAGFRSADISWKTRLKRQRQVFSSYQTSENPPCYFIQLLLWEQTNLNMRNESCLC